MLTRCFFCHHGLPANGVLEHFPTGERVAFDPWRGRLWAVCGHCNRWLLAPFDTRWEALEELERRVHDHGRVLARTDNVALFALGPLRAIRVGRVERREEAWWRYGDSIARRARKAQRIVRFGRFFDGAIAFVVAGIPYWGWSRPEKWIERARRHTFGAHAWRAPMQCARCGATLPAIRFADRQLLRLVPAADGGTELWHACNRCRFDGNSGFRVHGPAAGHLLRRVMAFHNFAGASSQAVADATSLVSYAGSADGFVRTLASQRPSIGLLPPTHALALEIAAHEARKRALLQQELGAIEVVWQQEERIAAIADGELTT